MAPKAKVNAAGKAKGKAKAAPKAKASAEPVPGPGVPPASEVATPVVRETNKHHLQRLDDALNVIMAHPVFSNIATAMPAAINHAAGHMSGDQVGAVHAE